jgi:5-(carboxyamino)imidazole ribonucleotide mutase/phosphoribosylaminoimidazole-succinocarboxamide synthase
MSKVVILMGSKSDLPFVEKIISALDGFGIAHEQRVASAHKSARRLLDLLAEYEASGSVGAYITVAGRSNALSGMADANVTAPVIACPPYSEKFGGADLYSSLRMPSGVAPAVVLEPSAAALLAAKILGLGDTALRDQVAAAQRAQAEKLLQADEQVRE